MPLKWEAPYLRLIEYRKREVTGEVLERVRAIFFIACGVGVPEPFDALVTFKADDETHAERGKYVFSVSWIGQEVTRVWPYDVVAASFSQPRFGYMVAEGVQLALRDLLQMACRKAAHDARYTVEHG